MSPTAQTQAANGHTSAGSPLDEPARAFATLSEAAAALNAAGACSRKCPAAPAPKRVVGPHETAALKLFNQSQVIWRSITVAEASNSLARPTVSGVTNILATKDADAGEVPPLFLLIPWDHDQNKRDDAHTDFAELRAKGQIRDRDGEVIEIKSIWHAWGAYRMDRFFQAYCRVAKDAHARGEPFPSDSVRDWVRDEAARIGMPHATALRIIRDGCGGNKPLDVPNAMWWRGASIVPPAQA